MIAGAGAELMPLRPVCKSAGESERHHFHPNGPGFYLEEETCSDKAGSQGNENEQPLLCEKSDQGNNVENIWKAWGKNPFSD
jgi:hypothetical protein